MFIYKIFIQMENFNDMLQNCKINGVEYSFGPVKKNACIAACGGLSVALRRETMNILNFMEK